MTSAEFYKNIFQLSETALFSAASAGNTGFLVSGLTSSKYDIENIGSCGKTLLMVAAECGHSDTVRKLLEIGAKVDRETEKGFTALMFAAMADKPEIVLILQKSGASITHRCAEDDNTPLHVACLNGKTQAAILLIQLGANIEVKNKFGQTPLMLAAKSGCDELVEHLLVGGANIKATTRTGQTALHEAAAVGSEKAAKRLLNHGADPFAKDRRGRTPLDLCTEEHKECRALLQETIAKLDQAANEIAEQLIQEEERKKEGKQRKKASAAAAKKEEKQTKAKAVKPNKVSSASAEQQAAAKKPKEKRNEASLRVNSGSAPAAEEQELPPKTSTDDDDGFSGKWTVVGKTAPARKPQPPRKNGKPKKEAEKPQQQKEATDAKKKPVKTETAPKVIKIEASSGKVIPGKSYADALAAASPSKSSETAPSAKQAQKQKAIVFKDQEPAGTKDPSPAAAAAKKAENEVEDEGVDEEKESEGEQKPVTIEDLEKRIKWLEMDARRAKSRRSKMLRLEHRVQTWQELLEADPSTLSLGITVEHVMESMFGSDGLRSLSASQLGELEKLHFAALRHISDAKVEIAKRQTIMDLKQKK